MGNVPFSEKNITSNFNGARSVASADVDGDGDIDILGAASDDNKITWWENETVLTSSISNYTPVIYETAVDFGDAASFDGVNDYVITNNLNGLNTGNQVHTIEQWVYLPELPSGRAWLSLLGQYGTGSHHWLVHPDGKMQIGVFNGGQLKPALNVGEWTHLATVYDGTTLTLYINGEEYGSTSANFNFTNTELKLGRGWRSDPYFKGEVDEVRIWNTARTEAEIKDNLYQPNRKRFYSNSRRRLL